MVGKSLPMCGDLKRSSRPLKLARAVAFSVGLGALLLSVGCGPAGALPTLVPGGTNTPGTDPFPIDLLDAQAGPPCARIGPPDSPTLEEMFEALNEYRIENGLDPLFYSQALEQAANDMAEDLWVRGFFAHVNPDGEGPADRALEAGFCNRYVGENLAAGHLNVPQVMQAWKESPGHNANMLTPGYRYVGMGHSFDGSGRQYWVQEFAYDAP